LPLEADDYEDKPYEKRAPLLVDPIQESIVTRETSSGTLKFDQDELRGHLLLQLHFDDDTLGVNAPLGPPAWDNKPSTDTLQSIAEVINERQ